MRFSQRVFFWSGIYGLVCLLPLYFLQDVLGRANPPPITHPEFYYGFIGVAVAWQVLFLLISQRPDLHRPLIVPAILEKLGYGLAIAVLLGQGRVSGPAAMGGFVDLLLAVLFAYCYVRLGREAKRSHA